MRSRLRLLLVALLWATQTVGALSLATPTRTVAVKANANVRAKPSVSSEILVSLKKGQPILVLTEVDDPKAAADEPRKWAEVVAPGATKAWVYAALIDTSNQVVRASSVNLRAGPGRNYSDVGSLVRGTRIKELRASDGWLEIEAPEGSVKGYIAASLLGEPVAAPVSAPAPTPTAPTPRLTTRPVPLPPPTTQPAPSVGRAVPAEPQVAPQVLRPARPVASRPPVTIEPIPTPADPVPTPAETPVAVETPTPSAPVFTETITLPPVNPAPATPEPTVGVTSQQELFYSDKVREVMREGILDYARSPQAPADFQLNNFRKGEAMLGFLYTEDAKLKLNQWRWKRVLVTGEEYIDPRWPRRPVIKVTAIREAH
jgi:SH3-like domain-containing protein